jgi:hypothetical protein
MTGIDAAMRLALLGLSIAFFVGLPLSIEFEGERYAGVAVVLGLLCTLPLLVRLATLAVWS